MDLLWPELGKEAASNNMRQTLHAARRALTSDPAEGSRYLASEDESLVLCPDGQLWVDVDAFEQAASTARRSREPTAYEAALDLYCGELLPADRYEEWAEEHRQRLRETRLSLLLGLAGIYEERADYDSAAEALRGVISEQSTREEAHAGLMRMYALMGSNREALAQYGRLEEALQEALGTEPSASSRALKEEITSGRFPPKDGRFPGFSLEEPPGDGKHNLPAPRTSFVGREGEMLEVKRILAMTRLLTLTGAGGLGKTRLALEVARDLVGVYPEGVWLVELAPLTEPELVVPTVARILEVREQPERPFWRLCSRPWATKRCCWWWITASTLQMPRRIWRTLFERLPKAADPGYQPGAIGRRGRSPLPDTSALPAGHHWWRTWWRVCR